MEAFIPSGDDAIESLLHMPKDDLVTLQDDARPCDCGESELCSVLIGRLKYVQTCEVKAPCPVTRAMRVWVAQLDCNERLLCSPVFRPHHVVRHASNDVSNTHLHTALYIFSKIHSKHVIVPMPKWHCRSWCLSASRVKPSFGVDAFTTRW
jgi:hypothetical protein